MLHSQKLFYDLIPVVTGEVKRLLKSVSQVAKDREVLLPLTLKWETDGEFAGHLSKIAYPRGEALEFGYSQKEALGYTPQHSLIVRRTGIKQLQMVLIFQRYCLQNMIPQNSKS